MDQAPEVVSNFEEYLKKNKTRNPIRLYNNSKQAHDTDYKPKDVLLNVSTQLKAILSADIGKSDRRVHKELSMFKKSGFLPVNKLPVYEEVFKQPAAPSKFETQCVTNTQLINVIEEAEALHTHKGMTQEFDISFSNTESILKNKLDCIKNKLKIDSYEDVEGKSSIDELNDEQVSKVTNEEGTKIDYDKESKQNDDSFTEILNNCILINDVDSERPTSPIFNHIKPFTKSTNPAPLIYNLEYFEKFEKIAVPLIEDNIDLNRAKHLINSQILGKELFIHKDIGYNVEQLSPVLEIKKEKDKKVTKEEVDNEIRNNCLEDEILFSSDEEVDYIHKELQDLPFTCALETSFYDTSDVLDKTMYVGFQTASNKSIQVSSDSFTMAQSILNDFDKDFKKDTTLRELVEVCDDVKVTNKQREIDSIVNAIEIGFDEEIKMSGYKIRSEDDNIERPSETSRNKELSPVPDLKGMPQNENISIITDSNKKTSKRKQSFDGFTTANNKRIKLSEQALARCRKVFQDIDLSEAFDTQTDQAETISKNNKVITSKDAGRPESHISSTALIANDLKFEDKDIDILIRDKINDDFIIKEFENTEMSLAEDKSTKEEKFAGFKTASKKNIIISNTALEKCQQIFQDIDFSEEMVEEPEGESILESGANVKNQDINSRTDKEETVAHFTGFKAASNKQINISEQALAKAMNIFKDLDHRQITPNKDLEESNQSTQTLVRIDYNQQSTSKVNFIGFKTANNKDINISKGALAKTMNIFKDIDTEPEQVKTGEEVFKRFKTASNKREEISNEAMAISKILFKDINTSNDSAEKLLHINKTIIDIPTVIDKPVKQIVTDNTINVPQNVKQPMFQGFQTASNKAVKISEEALAKSMKLFQDIDFNNEKPLTKVDQCQEFKTAGKRDVKVSEGDVDNSKKLLQDSTNFTKNLPSTLENKVDNAMIMFQGFKTASNKTVKISDDALAKSKKLFQDIDSLNGDILPIETKCNSSNETNIAFQGFKTASNKGVKITEVALAKSIELLKDIDSISDDMPKEPKVNNHKAFKGFKTGNNKAIKIDEETLAKRKKLCDETTNTNKVINKKDTAEIKFEGFKTGNNRAVISDEAIERSKKVFDIGGSQILEGEFKGFQTANKKEVMVSEEALAKSRKLFNDIDLDKPKDECKESGSVKMLQASIKTGEKIIAEFDKGHEQVKVKFDVVEIIDTQVLNDFEDTLYTEDFRNSPKRNKRSASPILSCPRAKKRKFETPYKTKEIPNEITKLKEIIVNENHNNYIFDRNYKKNKRFTLKDLAKFENGRHKNIDEYILSFNFDNLLEFEFKNERNDVDNRILTIEYLKEFFQASVNRKLIPKEWIDNHLRLILWKLISYEKKFPKTMKNVCTAKNIIEQLKYRYDKELFNAQRPVLRKILEKDDSSMRTMVLCVVGIYVDGVKVTSVTNTNNIELLLTDGWYCVKATIDRMLAKLVCDDKIVVGTKIVTNGAELVNCEQGVAPWEDTSAVRLKLFGNSTRRARWDARLGRHGNAAMLSHLSAVKLDGGKVSKLRVLVTRVYPALYVEKFEDGSTVTRSERLEHLHQMKNEAERQALMEKLYEEVEKEFADQESQDSDGSLNASDRRSSLDTGSQIAKTMKRCKEPMEFMNNLTHSQHALLNQYTNARRDRLLQDIQERIREKMDKSGLCGNRNIVPVLKVRVAGVDGERNNGVGITKGMLSIWKPNDAVQDIIKEGAWIEVMNVVPTAVRYSELQISAGRQSVFSQSKYKESEKVKTHTKLLKRACYLIKDLTSNPITTTDYNEIDTVGMIFSIDPSINDFESMKAQAFQNMYLADADKNIICINFWGGLKKFGFENVLDTGQIVSCTNLQKRAGNTRKNIPQYRVTEFTYFTKTPKNEAAAKIVDDLKNKLFALDKRKFCEDCITLRNNFAICKVQNSENISPYRLNNSDYNISKHKMFIDTPKRVDDFNLTGLDFESTFKQTETQDLSPKSLERKRRVNEKISRLKMYGEPPPLSTIHMINKSKNASHSYKSPLILKSDVPNSVASIKNIPEESPKTTNTCSDTKMYCSPVISMNKTYVKRSSVNPVKLNFSDSVAVEENGVTDAFAEEFDASPPLSLD